MKYLKNKSETLFIKDFENGTCVSININHKELSIRFERFIHFATIELIECKQAQVYAAFSGTMLKLMNEFHEIDRLLATTEDLEAITNGK